MRVTTLLASTGLLAGLAAACHSGDQPPARGAASDPGAVTAPLPTGGGALAAEFDPDTLSAPNGGDPHAHHHHHAAPAATPSPSAAPSATPSATLPAATPSPSATPPAADDPHAHHHDAAPSGALP